MESIPDGPASFAGMDKLDFLHVLELNRAARNLERGPWSSTSGTIVDLPPPFSAQSHAKVKAFNRRRLRDAHGEGVERTRRTAPRRRQPTDRWSPAEAYRRRTGEDVMPPRSSKWPADSHTGAKSTQTDAERTDGKESRREELAAAAPAPEPAPGPY